MTLGHGGTQHAHDARHRDRRGRAARSCRRSRASRKSATLTSDTVWDLRQLPRGCVVLGGGPIGCELAQCFARLGAQVTQVEMLPRILVARGPGGLRSSSRSASRAEGIAVLTGPQGEGSSASRTARRSSSPSTSGEDVRIAFDALLCAVGRVANTAGYGLEELGIPVTQRRTVETNEYLQTIYPNIYRLRRRRRPVPVHAHRVAPGVVRGGERALRRDSGNSAPTTR